MIGKTLAHYEITSQLGKGGMGEVYQAKDTKLGRDVAIKVLPEEFARDADRVARFQREAKLLASLNHPNIAAIYGLEESDGTNFLVMELVEGHTLDAQIKSGPIPVEEALKLALQIAEALEAAHEKGVIHRDLKPANIKVTPDGKVKVLDFGLAKAYAGDPTDLNLSNSPTLSDAVTQQGVILGTAAYMSPEQARGKEVDKRADIWAFGVVLFEMLTGQSLFSGEDVSSTLAKVLEREPDFSTLPRNLHPRIRLMLERCLEKDPKKRYSGMNDAWVDIDKTLSDPSGVLVYTQAAGRPLNWRLVLPLIAVAVVVASIISVLAVWRLKPVEPRRVTRFEYSLPEDEQFNLGRPCLAISPDGRQLVYSTNRGLYLRSLDESNAKLISGTEQNTNQPFFSPDGKWIGYFSITDQKLKKISVNGGTAEVLCDVQLLNGASWCEDNTIIFGQAPNNAIMQIPANGGVPKPILKTNSVNLFPLYPQMLEDDILLYSVSGGSGERAKVMVQSLKSGVSQEILPGLRARYISNGQIIYQMTGNRNVFAITFDLKRLEIKGESIRVVDDVSHVAVSDSGTLAYIPARPEVASGRTLVWVDREGKENPIDAPIDNYNYPKISPDGKQLALTIDDDIYIWDLVRKSSTRLTFNETVEAHAIWTRDGNRIVYSSDRDEGHSLYWKAADGTGTEELIISKPDLLFIPYTFSAEGKHLIGVEISDDYTKLNIGILSLEGEIEGKTLLENGVLPQISPDGRWMAYSWGEFDSTEVFVRPFPDVNNGPWQVSTERGTSPRWSPDGMELFYINNEGALMAVAVETKPTFRFEPPRILFHGPYVRPGPTTSIPYDISPDGKKFLMMKRAASVDEESQVEDPRKIYVVLNWFEVLKRKTPVQ